MEGQTLYELVEDVIYDFSAPKVAEFLVEVGLSTQMLGYEEESFESAVFLHGNGEEIYGKSERKFIESVGNIIVFSEFYKKTQKGSMPCRFWAVDLSDSTDEIYASVFLMKIINKAYAGFNIFLIKTTANLFVGLKLFNKDECNNCTLSEPKILPLLLEELWCTGDEDFLDFYNLLVNTFQPYEHDNPDYDELITRKRGVRKDYIDLLVYIEETYGESVEKEKDRYCSFFEEEDDVSFVSVLAMYMEELKDIKSSKVNTIEMLFEADEIERLANESERKQVQALQEEAKNENVDEEIVEQYRNDPEAMIRMLKKKKGLV